MTPSTPQSDRTVHAIHQAADLTWLASQALDAGGHPDLSIDALFVSRRVGALAERGADLEPRQEGLAAETYLDTALDWALEWDYATLPAEAERVLVELGDLRSRLAYPA